MSDSNLELSRDRQGTIDQMRDILLGQKTREYEKQFTNYDQRLDKVEADLSELQTETREHLLQLQDTFSTELRATLDSLEKKLKYLSLTTHETTSNLEQQLKNTNTKNEGELDNLNKIVADKSGLLREQLTETREQFDADLKVLKEHLFSEIDKGFSYLRESKVSRAVLAEVLFEMCIKVKGSDVFPSLTEEGENPVKSSFLLPDEQPDEPDA